MKFLIALLLSFCVALGLTVASRFVSIDDRLQAIELRQTDEHRWHPSTGWQSRDLGCWIDSAKVEIMAEQWARDPANPDHLPDLVRAEIGWDTTAAGDTVMPLTVPGRFKYFKIVAAFSGSPQSTREDGGNRHDR